MSETPSSSAAARLEGAVADLHVPEPKGDTEALLVKVGIALPVIGLILVGVAWYQSSGTAYIADQIPMLISGAILGIGLAIIGLGLFIRYSMARVMRFWMARLVVEQQAQTDRIVAAIERLQPPR